MTTEEFNAEAKRLRPQLLREAQRILRATGEAEDVVQDALLRLWQMHPQLRVPTDALAAVVTRNLAIDQLRKLRKADRSKDESLAAETPSPQDDDTDERTERILSIINALPTMQQTILRLRHMEGMEMRDIAEMTGATEVAVRKALSRARQAVRNEYFKVKSEK